MDIRETARVERAQSCACFNLRKAARAVTQLYDEALRPADLRATQFALLTATRLLGSAPMTRLAEIMGMDRTTLTRNLRPLERQGLIRVRPGSDGRVREVVLTERGQEALARALPLWERAQGRVVKGLGGSRWRRLLGDLTAMAALAGQR